MPIVTFWSESQKEVGQTQTAAAVATQFAIDHNVKVLLLSTQYNNREIESCFWDIHKQKRNLSAIFGSAPKVSLEAGIDGLIKAVSSNKMTPEFTTNYAKIVFQDRLEVLENFKGMESDYEKVKQMYPEIIQTSSSYYDLILIDLNKGLTPFTKAILDLSTVVFYGVSQRMYTLAQAKECIEKGYLAKKTNFELYCGKYYSDSKYNRRNLEKYFKVKDLPIVPWNRLYAEAAEEGKVVDYFLKIRTIKEEDPNIQFIHSIKELSNRMLEKIKEQQMKM